ncbi:cyclin-SDS [Tripterygium wilfordii]|uniref:B-like cyclin n=1 Tax=Tripterygium wilfordii TaxID=458696 RepID=A0A7J7DV98_TRIWF|nr:cyclin-SDS isoform X2 [Tripterygium wilfordii]KAF5750084.1 cyclin-SDS [Tripterygium wilfordii]
METTKARSSRTKRKIEPVPYVKRKQRSKLPRRVRSRFSPVLRSSLNAIDSSKIKCFSVISVDSTSCSYFGGEVSCDSNSVSGQKLKEIRGNEKVEYAPFRRITRSYLKNKEIERRGAEVELSESSVVESNCEVNCAVFGEHSSKFEARNGNLKSTEVSERSNAVTQSEISCVLQVSGAFRDTLSEIKKDNDSSSHKTVERRPQSYGSEYDLACAELLSQEYSSKSTSSYVSVFSELQSDVFPENSDFDFSDYSPSIFLDSGSEFSVSDSAPSITYNLFIEYSKQFTRSITPLDTKKSTAPLDQSTYGKFEDEGDEESYKFLWGRERRQVFLHDYTDEYRSSTEYGDLILQQRAQMIHWIVEQSTAKEYQPETMFLGVSLLDRFLSKGFFRNKRSLQVVGIACLTLAARIEENQPHNSVRQKNFYIERTVYSRSEVVAMEWLVQEVLSFQCFLPTIYNFLWFYLKAARADAEVEKRAKYLAVLALPDHEQLNYWPSTIAAALTILASLESNHDASSERVIEIHLRTKDNDLPDCMKSLEWLVQYVC